MPEKEQLYSYFKLYYLGNYSLYKVQFFKENWLVAPGIQEAQKKNNLIFLCFSCCLSENSTLGTPTKEMACKQRSYFLLLSCRCPQKFPPRPLTEEVEGGKGGGASELNNSPTSGKVSGDACNAAAWSGHDALK